MRDMAAEIFVERRYRTSHHNILVGTRTRKFLARNAETRAEKMKKKKKKERRGKKKREEERKKRRGELFFYKGSLGTRSVSSEKFPARRADV